METMSKPVISPFDGAPVSRDEARRLRVQALTDQREDDYDAWGEAIRESERQPCSMELSDRASGRSAVGQCNTCNQPDQFNLVFPHSDYQRSIMRLCARCADELFESMRAYRENGQFGGGAR